MNIARTIVPLAIAIVCSGCAVNSGDSEPVGTAEQRLVVAYLPPGVTHDVQQQTFDFVNSVEVDLVNGHAFTTFGSVDFQSISGLNYNSTTIADCEASTIFVDLEKFNGTSWVTWDEIGTINAVATSLELGEISCKATWSHSSTSFVTSTELSVFQDYTAGDGSTGEGLSAIDVHQDS